MTAIRWGIIGCGDVTEVKSGPGFQAIEDSSLVAVMHRNGPLAADYARRHGVPRWYDRADQLIEDPEVNAVYIATPPGSHLEYALQVCAAGKPAYVEKPMARNHAECLRPLFCDHLSHFYHLEVMPLDTLESVQRIIVPAGVRCAADEPVAAVVRDDHTILLQRL